MINNLLDLFRESANSFEGQEEGETVLTLQRRFPLEVITQVIVLFGSILLPIGLGLTFMQILINYNLVNLFWFGVTLWALMAWLFAFYNLTLYSLDVWIVTDRRIIDATQQGLFNRTISELHLGRVQDISVVISGPLESFFYFGTLIIQTAGTEEHFKFHEISHPEKVKDIIMQASSHQKEV